MKIKLFLPTIEKLHKLRTKAANIKHRKNIIKITENNFYHFFFNKAEKCLYVKKFQSTSQMTVDQYKEQIINWLKINIKYRPEKILVDNSAFDFIITPEIQKWVNQNLLKPSESVGVKKIAFISSPNIFTDVSIRQTMEEYKLKIEFKFFDNITAAKQWLEINNT